jgi:hypothetical protein
MGPIDVSCAPSRANTQLHTGVDIHTTVQTYAAVHYLLSVSVPLI